MNITRLSQIFIFFAVAAIFLVGCGPEDHAPSVKCFNFGIENVRRSLRLRASIDVPRTPLDGVSSETVQLLKLPQGTPVAGEVYYSGERILFTPSLPLADTTQYRFEIKQGITDASGRELQATSQEFWTGKVLQVYWVNLLRTYNTQSNEIDAIGIYFSEAVDSNTLNWGEYNINIYDDIGSAQFFSVTYYREIALAVLIFGSPLTTGKNYTLRLGMNISSGTDGGRLDGDRDGQEVDFDPFIMHFKYETSLSTGLVVSDSLCEAQPYNESINRCFLGEFD